MSSTVVHPDGALTIVRGDTLGPIPIQVVAPDGVTPVDLSGSSIASQVRSKPNGYVALELFVSDVDLPLGKFTLYSPPENTALLRLTAAWWDVQVTYGSGAVETIIGPAEVEVVKDITLPAA